MAINAEFDAPIPGQSLTTPPKNAPYERPPEIVDPEEAIQMHLMRLSEPKPMQGIIDSLELGMDIKSVTKGYLRSAVMSGVHTTEVSMLVAPIIHEFIKQTADEAGIDYEEGLDDKDEPKTRRKIEFEKAKAKLAKRKGLTKEANEKELVSMDSEELPRDTLDEGEPPAQGLMKRRGAV